VLLGTDLGFSSCVNFEKKGQPRERKALMCIVAGPPPATTGILHAPSRGRVVSAGEVRDEELRHLINAGVTSQV